jgi:hypothetical protein
MGIIPDTLKCQNLPGLLCRISEAVMLDSEACVEGWMAEVTGTSYSPVVFGRLASEQMSSTDFDIVVCSATSSYSDEQVVETKTWYKQAIFSS